MCFHRFCGAIHGDIYSKVSCTFVGLKHLYTFLEFVRDRSNGTIGRVWAKVVRYCVSWGPGVQGAIVFLWVQGTSSDLDKLVPPLQLGLHKLNQYIDFSQGSACQHCHIVKECFDDFGDCKGKSWL